MLSLNVTLNSIPVSPYKKSFSELEDSKSRRREPGNYEPAYPEVVSSSLREPTSASSPIIPLSPDPFGRYSSFHSTPSPPSRPSPFLDKPLAQPMTRYSAVEVPPEQRASGSHSVRDSLASTIEAPSRPPSSRFSLDSTDEGKNNRFSASLNPVKSIKSLWKRGRKASISSGSGSGVAALQIGPSPPSPQPPPPPVPSISSTSSPRSLTPSTASRESVTSLVIPSERHAPKALYHDTPSLSTSQLQQSRSSPTMRSMFFNQESPYPVHVLPSNSTRRRRTASQTARVISSASLADADVMPPTPSLPPPSSEKEKATVPKSILKSRRTESSTSMLSTEQQHTVSRSQSRADAVLSRSMSSSGGGMVTPPTSSYESTRTSPTKSRQRTNLPPLPW